MRSTNWKLGAGSARLCSLEHDRTEGARGHDRPGSSLAKLLEADVADAAARLFLLVREQQAAAGATAVRVLAIAHRFADLAAKSRQQLAGLVDVAAITSEIARIMERHRLSPRPVPRRPRVISSTNTAECTMSTS